MATAETTINAKLSAGYGFFLPTHIPHAYESFVSIIKARFDFKYLIEFGSGWWHRGHKNQSASIRVVMQIHICGTAEFIEHCLDARFLHAS